MGSLVALLIILLGTLSGCATTAETSRGEYESALSADAALRPIQGKIAMYPGQAPTLEMLANEQVPTAAEREAIKAFAFQRQRYLRALIENERSRSTPYAPILEAEAEAEALLLAELYQARLTYSEFATRKERVRLEANALMDQAYAGMKAQRDRQMTEIGSALLQQGMARPIAPGSSGPNRGGFLKSSYVSGMNRICLYSGVGGSFAINIGATEFCPLTAP